jgi:glutamate synthase domain-containing protein 2
MSDYKRLVNLITAWEHEIQEMMAAWGSTPSKLCAETD